MALRAGHGAGAGVPRIEVLPADEIPVGVAAPEQTAQAEIIRQTTAAARIDSLQEKPDARLIRRMKANEMHGERADIIANSTA